MVTAMANENIKKEGRAENREDGESFSQALAAYLERPYQGSYLKKLQRLAGAFVLAGISLFASREVSTPELTPEYIISEVVVEKGPRYMKELLKDIDPKILTRILQALEEKGGIPISVESEQLYKPKEFGRSARRLGFLESREKGEVPYFSKPEAVFGKQFLRDHRKEAEVYWGRIQQAMKATVVIDAKFPKGWGSGAGVIIHTDRGMRILTNRHVLGPDAEKIYLYLIDGTRLKGVFDAGDDAEDIALLDVIEDTETESSPAPLEQRQSIEKIIIEGGANPLSLAKHSFEEGQKHLFAAIGHPLGFPYEVGLAEFEDFKKKELGGDLLLYKPDKRFEYLVHYGGGDPKERDGGKGAETLQDFARRVVGRSYFIKGEGISGMSGGPVIDLDAEEGPKLVGLTSSQLWRKRGEKEKFFYLGAIPAARLQEFIKKYEEY
jgi:hypothetical protein